MKKIVVCGDSFQSISMNEYKDTHWSEILAKKLDWDLINLAMPGCSNSVIVLQIMEAIELKPDFLVIGWSAGHGNRIEYLKNVLTYSGVGKINLGHFVYKHRQHPYEKLNYHKNTILTSSQILDIPHEKFKQQMLMFSDTSFFGYFKEECMMIYSIMKVSKFKIPFLMFETGIGNHPFSSHWINEMLDFCEEKNIIFKEDINLLYKEEEYKNSSYPIYHTSIQTQKNISNFIEKKMKEIIK